MKKLLNIVALGAGVLMAFASCSEKYITYNDAEYVMFSESEATYAIREDILSFEVPVVSTVICDYDRTFAVEVIDEGSSAVEGRDYTLESNTFVIKAGENKASVKVNGVYDALEFEKDRSFNLRLVVPDRLVMPLYGDQTKVNIKKFCKFRRENFTGYALVTSVFLYTFSPTGDYQRLISTVPDPDNENGVILKNFLFDGYDVKISLDDTDPMNPTVNMEEGQVVSDEAMVFGIIHGDNHILAMVSPLYASYLYAHRHAVNLCTRMFVNDIGTTIGTVGDYMNIIEWVSDEEAMRIRKEYGM